MSGLCCSCSARFMLWKIYTSKPNSCNEEGLVFFMLMSVRYVAKLRLVYQKQEFKMRHRCKSHTRRQKRWSLPTTDAEYKGDQTNRPSMSYPEGLGARCGQCRCLQSTRCEKGMEGYASGRAASNTRSKNTRSRPLSRVPGQSLPLPTRPEHNIFSSLLVQKVRSTRTTFSLVLAK